MTFDILQDFPINAGPARVFEAVSTPSGLDAWWTRASDGQASVGAVWQLDFGPEYHWKAIVTKAVPGHVFELQMAHSDADWNGTVVGFELSPLDTGTKVHFYHRGWPEANAHFRISCHCWALYLRILRRHLEFGEDVPYEDRLQA